ncbi:MAG: molybdenum cofactor guanylyltransferase [Deltaproteobacteria bacterium]|nr:molybdenum cofactor guanylyltransferase [Deltaproteobacteria bacterium]
MGCDKALLPLGGKPLIAHLTDQLGPRFDQVLVSAASTDDYAFLGLEVVADQQPGMGPLMGIASAVAASRNERNLVVACDVPEIDLGFAETMLVKAETCDAVVPVTGPARYETLLAVYNKSALPAMLRVLEAGKRRIIEIFPLCRVEFIELSAGWYRNINTWEDWERYLAGLGLGACPK